MYENSQSNDSSVSSQRICRRERLACVFSHSRGLWSFSYLIGVPTR